MIRTKVVVTIDASRAAGREILAPLGIPTPHQTPLCFSAEGGALEITHEATTGQCAALIDPDGSGPVTLTIGFQDRPGRYPDAMFNCHPDRATGGDDAIETIVNETADRFSHLYPVTMPIDGDDGIARPEFSQIKAPSAGINTQLVSALRAAGFEAGLVTGYFFAEETGGQASGMHCWVVTRHEGTIREWDVAHHLKMGRCDISPGLDLLPGHRVALAHSMDLEFPALGLSGVKLLTEAAWVDGEGGHEWADIVAIRATRNEEPDAAYAKAAEVFVLCG